MRYKMIEPILPILNGYSVQEKIFSARGIPPNEIYHYLNTTDEDVIDPEELDNLKEGATMIIKHIQNGDKIYVLVDCDVDGFTSAACLINYLHDLFPYAVETKFEYGVHSGKQHGLSDQMEMLKHSDYKLVICPDSSSND